MRYFPYSDITIEQILTFINVAKTLNMTKSAEELSVTQSAISKRISSFEESTGLILFTKHKKVMRLTPAGEFLYKRIKKEYDDLREAFDTAREIQANGKPKFNIGVCMSIAPEDMNELVEEFRKAYPDVEINIEVWIGEGIVKKMTSGELDVLFIHTVHIDKIAQLEYYNFCISHIFLASSKAKTRENMLSDGLALYYEHSEEINVLMGDILALRGLNKNKVNFVNSMDSVYYNILYNNRAAVLGAITARKWSEDEKLMVCNSDITYDMCICWNKERSEYVDTFVKIFKEKMQEENFRYSIEEYMGIHLYDELK
ncbi:MAG: LysR family transcriptional regulator [Eubacteriaceae bacterium]|nr:LysR family transcriptional regulator [Eubacteriaceae bacterium]